MRRVLILLAIAAAVASCTEAIPNRAESPEDAFHAARLALRNRDLPSYVDALTESAVRDHLKNSVMICLGKNHPKAVAGGLKDSVGCEDILLRHDWPAAAAASTDAYLRAIARIRNPRAMVVELEANHRKYGVGGSFAWGYLENVKLGDLTDNSPRTAAAIIEWESGDKRPVKFEKDETGWRFDSMLRED